jgi:aminopeptidase-like protein
MPPPSPNGPAALDQAARHVLNHRDEDYESGAFRTVYGNDEIVFEGPGYQIPSITLTRYPFDFYHTDHDTPDRLSEGRLQEAADIAFDICRTMEMDVYLKATSAGVPCLSHPRNDLYVPVWDPSLRSQPGRDAARDWNLLMNCLPRYMDGATSLLDIAERHGLPIGQVYDYAMRWVEKGLAELCADGCEKPAIR